MEYGELFRQLRKEKGYKQKEIISGLITRATLSRFENGRGEIGLSVFFELLKKIGVTPTEYYYLYEEQSKDFLANQQLDAMKKLAKKIKNQYLKTMTFDENDAQTIRDYLLSHDVWRIPEVTIYIHCLFIFNFKQRLLFHKEVRNTLDTYFDDDNSKELRSNYYISLFKLRFEQHEFKEMENRLSEFLSYSPKELDLYAHIWANFFFTLYNDIKENTNKHNEILHCVEKIGLYDFHKELEQLAQVAIND